MGKGTEVLWYEQISPLLLWFVFQRKGKLYIAVVGPGDSGVPPDMRRVFRLWSRRALKELREPEVFASQIQRLESECVSLPPEMLERLQTELSLLIL